MTQGQTAISGQPGHRTFDHPPVSYELLAELNSPTCDADPDTPPADRSAQLSAVIGFVGVQLAWFASAGATPGTDGRNAHDQGLERVGIISVRRGHPHRER